MDKRLTHLKELVSIIKQLIVKKRTVQIEGFGEVTIPNEFVEIVSSEIFVRDTDSTKPSEILELIKDGKTVVMTGDFRYIMGILKYMDRNQKELINRDELKDIENKFERSRISQSLKKRALYRLMVVAKGDILQNITRQPELTKLLSWLEGDTEYLSNVYFLLPVRKVLRIASDVKRKRDGLYISALNERISVFPHVYVPFDESVVNMIAENLSVTRSTKVLDVGTGTGILALVAAKAGSHNVVATDINPQAVENAKFNAKKLGFQDRIDVREPAELFDSVQDEKFDIILFNAPWLYGEPKTTYDTAVYDSEFSVITRFFGQVGDYLSDTGFIMLQYSNFSELTGHGAIENLNRLIAENGFEITQYWSIKRLSKVMEKWETVFTFEIRRSGQDLQEFEKLSSRDNH